MWQYIEDVSGIDEDQNGSISNVEITVADFSIFLKTTVTDDDKCPLQRL
jgi:hypothetical protein